MTFQLALNENYKHHELGKLQNWDDLVSDNGNSVNNFEIDRGK